jgi:sigma-E factor negative regulatory protein RseC
VGDIMGNSDDSITHPGTIADVGDDHLKVRIMNVSACAACHAKGVCSIADMKEKIIEVKRHNGENYSVGDHVRVTLGKSLGARAVVLAYIVPLCILVVSLVILISLALNEGLAAMIAIGLMVPYYLVLYFMRDRLKRSFDFKIQPDF